MPRPAATGPDPSFPILMRRGDMLYDLSPPLSEALAVWPGDTALKRQILQHLDSGHTVTLSTLRATAHLGSHADAPSHYGRGAPAIDEQPLDAYLGPCQIIAVNVPRGSRIEPADLPQPIVAPRVLIRTGTFGDPRSFTTDFAAIDPRLIAWLAERGVRLIGVDTPSVDLFDSTDLPAHRACLEHCMAILEGLVLSGVPEGVFELIALPLRLVGFDASPVRAVLRTLDEARYAAPGPGGAA